MKNLNWDVPFISFLRLEQIKDYSKINDNYQYTLSTSTNDNNYNIQSTAKELICSNQEQVQWVAGWRAWTPNYKTSALTTQLHFFPYMYGSIVVYFVWYGCLSWHTIFFFFREYFLETLNTCGYNYQVHTGILILYNDKLTSWVLIHLQS